MDINEYEFAADMSKLVPVEPVKEKTDMRITTKVVPEKKGAWVRRRMCREIVMAKINNIEKYMYVVYYV